MTLTLQKNIAPFRTDADGLAGRPRGQPLSNQNMHIKGDEIKNNELLPKPETQ
jgi:hypothetical protein